MKKLLIAAVAVIVGAGFAVGCSGNTESGGSETTATAPRAETASAVSEKALPETKEPIALPPPETEGPAVTEHETVTAVPAEETAETSESAETAEAQPDIYAEMLAEFDNGYLGLPQKDKVYIFRSADIIADIDGAPCYAVSCYDEHEGELYYMCDFYISEDGSAVYRFYDGTGEYTLLPESKPFTQMDPTTQTPEEIFDAATHLYTYCLAGVMPCDYENYLEYDVDGIVRKFYLVTDENFDTKIELLNALSCYFSVDIINSVMDIYREDTDGRIYKSDTVIGGAMGLQSIEYELNVLTEDAAEFTVYSTHMYEDGTTSTNENIYNAVKRDGRWFFTNFELPY